MIILLKNGVIKLTEKEELKKCITDSINKIENMIKENKEKKIINQEREKLDQMLEKYLKDK